MYDNGIIVIESHINSYAFKRQRIKYETKTLG